MKAGMKSADCLVMTPCTAFQRRGSGNKCKRQTTLFFFPLSHFCSCRREIERIQKMEGIQLHLRPLSTDTELHLYRQVVLMLHRLCPLCSLTPRTRFEKNVSKIWGRWGGKKTKPILRKSGTKCQGKILPWQLHNKCIFMKNGLFILHQTSCTKAALQPPWEAAAL